MKLKPRIYKQWYGTLPWTVRSGLQTWAFSTWDEALHFVVWFTAEPTA